MIALIAVLLSVQEAAGERTIELTGGSIAFMLTAMTAVTALMVWCFARVLRSGDLESDGAGSGEPSVEKPGSAGGR